jgi:hypothetical protein
MMTTESAWGLPDMNPEIREALTETVFSRDEDGQLYEEKKQLWDRFSIYTRDLRLGNIAGQELTYCNYVLDLAFQLLQKDMYRSASIALGYVATVIETSQSKNGFLRRRMNTLTNESVNMELEPPKKRIFGKNNGEM